MHVQRSRDSARTRTDIACGRLKPLLSETIHSRAEQTPPHSRILRTQNSSSISPDNAADAATLVYCLAAITRPITSNRPVNVTISATAPAPHRPGLDSTPARGS